MLENNNDTVFFIDCDSIEDCGSYVTGRVKVDFGDSAAKLMGDTLKWQAQLLILTL